MGFLLYLIVLKSKKYFRTIIRIPDDLRNEIKNILPDEKPKNTRGRPIVPYRKVLWYNLYPKNCMTMENVTQRKSIVLVLHVIEDFKNGYKQISLIESGQDY